MKQRKKYPKTAKAIAGFALFLCALGLRAPQFFLLAGFFGLIALILALGPDRGGKRPINNTDDNHPKYIGDDLTFDNGKWTTRLDAGESLY